MAKAWDDANYGYRKEILVQSANVDSNLTDFPVLVKIVADTDITTAKVQADLDDIRFYDHNGTALDYEVDTYVVDGTNLDAEIWVRVPTVYASPTGDQNKIWMYYGYGSAVNGEDGTGVWDASYKCVLHLGDSSPFQDSTAGNHDATTIAGAPAQIASVVGYGRDFNAAGTDYLTASDHADFTMTAGFTAEAWLKLGAEIDNGKTAGLIGQWGATGAGNAAWQLRLTGVGGTANYIGFRTYDGSAGSGFDDGTTDLAPGTQYHVAVVYDGGTSGTNGHIYVNGTQVASGTVTKAPQNSGYDVFFCRDAATGISSVYYDGVVDEARISSTNRSAAWIKFQYANIWRLGDNELTWGSEETPSGGVSFSSLMRHLGTWNSAGYKELRIGPVTTA